MLDTRTEASLRCSLFGASFRGGSAQMEVSVMRGAARASAGESATRARCLLARPTPSRRDHETHRAALRHDKKKLDTIKTNKAPDAVDDASRPAPEAEHLDGHGRRVRRPREAVRAHAVQERVDAVVAVLDVAPLERDEDVRRGPSSSVDGLEQSLPRVAVEGHVDAVAAHDDVKTPTITEVVLQDFGAGARPGERDRPHVFTGREVGRHVPCEEVDERPVWKSKFWTPHAIDASHATSP